MVYQINAIDQPNLHSKVNHNLIPRLNTIKPGNEATSNKYSEYTLKLNSLPSTISVCIFHKGSIS